MDTKEEINIELEQILEERRHKLNELSEEEVAKASGGVVMIWSGCMRMVEW